MHAKFPQTPHPFFFCEFSSSDKCTHNSSSMRRGQARQSGDHDTKRITSGFQQNTAKGREPLQSKSLHRRTPNNKKKTKTKKKGIQGDITPDYLPGCAFPHLLRHRGAHGCRDRAAVFPSNRAASPREWSGVVTPPGTPRPSRCAGRRSVR